MEAEFISALATVLVAVWQLVCLVPVSGRGELLEKEFQKETPAMRPWIYN